MITRDNKDYFGAENRYVKELTAHDFNGQAPWQLKETKGKRICSTIFILFYLPDCPYCKDIAPIWQETAKLSGFCDFYALNCEKYAQHVSKIKEDMPALLRSYPTIIIYKNGVPDEYYNGERTSSAILQTCMRNCKK